MSSPTSSRASNPQSARVEIDGTDRYNRCRAEREILSVA